MNFQRKFGRDNILVTDEIMVAIAMKYILPAKEFFVNSNKW